MPAYALAGQGSAGTLVPGSSRARAASAGASLALLVLAFVAQARGACDYKAAINNCNPNDGEYWDGQNCVGYSGGK